MLSKEPLQALRNMAVLHVLQPNMHRTRLVREICNLREFVRTHVILTPGACAREVPNLST